MVRSDLNFQESNTVMDIVCHDGTQYISADIYEGNVTICGGAWVKFIVDDYVVLIPSSNIKNIILREEKAD